jgi:cyclophilin family peptidyl-prolyl cis-trans isomerase
MTLRSRRPLARLFVSLLTLALFAAACSGSSGEGDVATVDGDRVEQTETTSPEETEPLATSIPVPADDSAADEAIAGLDDSEPSDPTETARGFIRSRFNIDPEPEWLSCIVAEADTDETLDAALRSPAVLSGQVDDAQLRPLTFAMNGCMDSIGLADWATQAVGPRGDVQQTAPPCLAERFDDPDNGDLTFYTFVSLVYQFRIDRAGVDGLVSSLTECAPITSLGDFFAEQAEQASGFNSVVDRDCLNDALSPPEVSQEFWSVFVDGGQPPVSFITPFTDGCTTDAPTNPADDLPSDLPADFIPWSGTKALASISPAARAGIYDAPPPMTIDPARSYEAVLATGGGEIRIQLFADTAPVTVNNFVNLANDGYFDGTIFHRVLDEFMAQGGDPTGTGTGGPGYQFQDEFDGGRVFDRTGLLAMANSGPGTNGSQFFITFIVTDWLTGGHTIFGEVTEGMDLVNAIQRRDPAANGPAQTLDSVTIIES